MQNHIKVYLKYFDIGEQDVWYCERCGQAFNINRGLNIHHIYGRGKNMDVIENLMSLCQQDCHMLAHSSRTYVSKREFQTIHENFMKRHERT